MNKDQLYNTIMKSNKEMVCYISKLDKTLDKINDQNILHSQILKSNTDILKEMTIANQATIGLFKRILITIILALIVLAGAEKVLEFSPKLP